MDSIGSIDPYLLFQFGNSQVQTPVQKDITNPKWNSIIYLALTLPNLNRFLSMQLYDWENIADDELVGSTQFLFTDIRRGAFKTPFWVNIYGILEGLMLGS